MESAPKRLIAILSLGLIASVAIARSTTLDTLSRFNHRARYHYYRIPNLSVQAARFEPASSGRIVRISVLLGGHNASGEARLRVFGNEAGAPAPFLERDLISPIIVRKSKIGVEKIEIALPDPVEIHSHQFFVAVDRLSDGTQLITDTEKKLPSCVHDDELFGCQYVKSGGRWFTGQYAFAVDVVMEYDAKPGDGVLTDVTKEVGNWDSAAANGSIAWGDVNGDSYLDLLVGGKLYENRRGESFTDISASAGITGRPIANLFIDVNNDKRLDILFLGDMDGDERSTAQLFIAGDDGHFRRKALSNLHVGNPTSFSVADADNDGYLDLFVGQGNDTSGRPLPNLLLINDRRSGFTDRSSTLYPADRAPLASQGSQWVDVNGDGLPDLFVVNQGEDNCELWRNNGDGTFSMVYGPKNMAPAQIRSTNGIGGHWMDHNGDGRPDLLLGEHTRLSTVAGNSVSVDGVMEASSAAEFALTEVPFEALGIPYAELRGGGTWGDIDADGELDLLLASGGECHHADLYLKNAAGGFDAKTAEYGLLHLAAGPGAIFVDYNNDGALDLATTLDGHFRLFRNKSVSPNHYVAIDLPQESGTGASVQVFAGDRHYGGEIASGRGILMQDPMRLHIGVGTASTIDSVVVRWPNGRSETIMGIPVDALTKLAPGDGVRSASAGALSEVGAYPNPFTDKVEFVYQLAARRNVTLQIFDQQGHLVRQIEEKEQAAGIHKVLWTGLDDRGERLPQGAYLYRITAGAEQVMGKISLIR